jgi:RNA polymerase sigma-70 factor (ECF subfamily)
VDDREWAKLIVSGDEPAKSRFVVAFHGPIYRWLRYLSGSDDAAQELTQEAFLEALQSVSRYEGRASLSTWMHRVAYYRYTHWLREQRRDIRWHAPLESAEEYADPAGQANWESLCLRQALAQLSEEHRDTFVLHYVQALSVPEVAEVLGIPPGTVQSRLFHARRRLRDLLSEGLDSTAAGDGAGRNRPPGGGRDTDNIHEVIIR